MFISRNSVIFKTSKYDRCVHIIIISVSYCVITFESTMKFSDMQVHVYKFLMGKKIIVVSGQRFAVIGPCYGLEIKINLRINANVAK